MSDERWLDDAQQAAWRRLIAVTMLLPYELDVQLQRDADLTHYEYLTLAMLSETPGRALRMSQLAERSNASQSRTSHVVAKLERRGYVRRERSASDGRGNLATLTSAGLAKLESAAPGHVDAVRTMVFDALTPAQVRQLERIAAAVLTRLEGAHDTSRSQSATSAQSRGSSGRPTSTAQSQ